MIISFLIVTLHLKPYTFKIHHEISQNSYVKTPKCASLTLNNNVEVARGYSKLGYKNSLQLNVLAIHNVSISSLEINR